MSFLHWHPVILVKRKFYNGLLNINNKSSAFESEIHPLHKLYLCNWDFVLAEKQVCSMEHRLVQHKKIRNKFRNCRNLEVGDANDF